MSVEFKNPPIRFLKSLLRPVLRYCLRHSIKLQDFMEICKLLFLEEAAAELNRCGQEVSASRLAVMTGVHRKDVTRLQAGDDANKRTGDIAARIVGHWQSNKKFLTQNGRPRVISHEGSDSEFVELVRAINRELNPYTLLFELERAGTVERTARGLKLKAKTFLSKKNLNLGLHFVETDSDDLLCAAEENLFAELEIPNLHIKTEYDKIPEKYSAQVRSWIIELGEKFHQQARSYLARLDLDTSRELTAPDHEHGPFLRVAVGTFSRIEETSKQEQ